MGQLSHCAPNTNLSGYLVHIPGRAFSVFTGANGSFQIDNVPAGTYTIAVEHDAIKLSIPDVVVGDATVVLDPVAVGTCAPACVPTGPEVCDGIDNNCDGTIDEGGVCGPACTPTGIEVCDGVDNDCDGEVDEDSLGAGQMCGSGLPGACGAGVLVCTNGAMVCMGAAEPGSMIEVCDGQDNNCDGTVDEGNPGGGAACNTGMPGACNAGVRVCSGGALSCVATASASAEVCDGIDNDCDGSVDEGAGTMWFLDADGDGFGTNSQTTQACTRPAGFAAAGADCNDANAAINPARPEVCDGVDNNCNANIDEGGGNLCAAVTNGAAACGGVAGCTVGACFPGFGNCDNVAVNGCEINVLTSVNNCGACGNVCNFPNAVEACTAGQCQLLGCQAGFTNCDGNIVNGCETFGSCSVSNNATEWKQWQ